ncbi:N-acetylmuramic acid 6-phosphate etherase [Virgisporangium aliadipatigenens]|uniref:N-acetylmuramic acid 6-phosphate etherase n=1 Tax=Virgisporangium aliadipatigenens TaxID=741659 RepID=A0A8J3YPY5_9ACTN|nr:N-acetylmuramic acid 6-phosphate etherase [Virgisporangium aliadipatigenens]GIJ47678.1 N-acetylmuramic acid 6-phosphate etherase [Virgisporangium aliadipatigenens]
MELDLLPTDGVVAALLDNEARVVPAVRAATPALVAAAELIATRLSAAGGLAAGTESGARLVLLGAGTSGRLAVLQAAELPGTFGLPVDRIVGRTAGGGSSGGPGTDYDEDDADAGRRDLLATGLRGNGVLVAVAASGRTPYTIAAALAARELGAAVVAVTARTGSPLAELADVAVEIEVGPEVLRGSTRLTAGTAQKLALDAITTAAMVRLGRVHGDVMVDVVPANAKLRDRSAGLVAGIAGCTEQQARDALERCRWNARAAVLTIVGDLAPEAAVEAAAAHPTLRGALDAFAPRVAGERSGAAV